MVTSTKCSLLLITGIPGTGKTCIGNRLANESEFLHFDLEDPAVLDRWSENPTEFVQAIAQQGRNAVVTWGFNPDHEPSVQSVLYFKQSGFKLVWLDGNRPAALREFRKRGDVAEMRFHVQMHRIEHSKIIDRIKPSIINSFDELGQFKPVEKLLDEIKRA
jgi:adenylate kinase family enzyme